MVATRSKLRTIDPKDKGNKKLVEVSTKVSNAQAAIDVEIQRVDEVVEDRLSEFDKWVDYRLSHKSTSLLFKVRK